MPFFRQTDAQKFTPTKIKFFDLYKHSTGTEQPSGSVQEAARQALAKAGFDELTTNKIIFENQAVSVDTMQRVASQLNQSQIYGFYHDPKTSVKNYLRKQMVKNMSLARIGKEHMLEQRADALEALRNKANLGKINADGKTTTSKLSNAPKPTPRYRLPY